MQKGRYCCPDCIEHSYYSAEKHPHPGGHALGILEDHNRCREQFVIINFIHLAEVKGGQSELLQCLCTQAILLTLDQPCKVSLTALPHWKRNFSFRMSLPNTTTYVNEESSGHTFCELAWMGGTDDKLVAAGEIGAFHCLGNCNGDSLVPDRHRLV